MAEFGRGCEVGAFRFAFEHRGLVRGCGVSYVGLKERARPRATSGREFPGTPRFFRGSRCKRKTSLSREHPPLTCLSARETKL